MRVSRRRLLTITAAAVAGGAIWQARTPRYTLRFRAFGADAEITLRGETRRASAVASAIRGEVTAIERALSLYDPRSELSRLNAMGVLVRPSVHVTNVMRAAQRVYVASGGLFDPTIQGLWRGDQTAPPPRFADVEIAQGRIKTHGHQLSFNGIAQGYASDVISDLLMDYGFEDILVSLGEYRARGGPWYIAPPSGDPIQLTHGAVATSQAAATQRPDGQSHLIHPRAGDGPIWNSVTVEAGSAVMADGWATAMSFMSRDEIAALDADAFDLRAVTLETQRIALI